MKKHFGTKAFLCLVLTVVLSLSVGLGTVVSYADETVEEDVNNNLQIPEENIENTDEIQHTGAENGETGEENFFTLLYSMAMDNFGEIFSLLAFVGTLVVGFLYKKGLLPLFSKAVSSIGQGIGQIKEESARASEASGVKIDGLCEKLAELENSFIIFSESLSSLEGKLKSEQAALSERNKMSVIMNSQVDLLYDIFMSSSLPEYKKEAVGAKFLQMREELEKNELTESEK